MRNFGLLNLVVTSNLDRVYLSVCKIESRAVFLLAKAYILGPERW